jgi:hypothetical protein
MKRFLLLAATILLVGGSLPVPAGEPKFPESTGTIELNVNGTRIWVEGIADKGEEDCTWLLAAPDENKYMLASLNWTGGPGGQRRVVLRPASATSVSRKDRSVRCVVPV